MTPPTAPERHAGYTGLGIWGGVGLALLFWSVSGFGGMELALLQVLAGVRLNFAVQFMFVHLLGSCAVLWVALPRSGLSLAAAFPLHRFRLALVPPILIVIAGLLAMSPWLMPPPPQWLLQFARSMSGGGFLPATLVVGIEAPIMEELIFRGLLLGALRRRYSTGTAAIVSTALFVLFHANLTQGMAALLMGSLACWLVLRTGSLLPAILVHLSWNSSMQLSELLGPATARATGAWNGPGLFLGGALATAIGVLALWWLLRDAPRPPRPAYTGTPRRARARLATALLLPLGLVIVTSNFAPLGKALALLGVPEPKPTPHRPRHNPAPLAGCYELTSAGAPLTLLGDPGAVALRLRLSLDTLPQAGGVTHYAVQALGAAPAAPPSERPYWFIDSGGVLRIARTSPEGGTVLRVRREGESVAGTVARYGRAGEAVGTPGQVTGRRVACPAR